jgi:hypothetical protein
MARMANPTSRRGRFRTTIIVAIALLLAAAGEVRALSESTDIALVPNARGRSNFGGVLPTSGFPGGYAPTFTNVNPFAIGATEDLSGFDTVVLVGICDIGSANFLDNPSWKATINGFIAGGGKLIIWDSECRSTDYSKFLLPFTTDNPGPHGASGTLSITEENSLSRSAPAANPRFVDVGLVGSGTDAVGDANVFLSFNPLWCVDMRAINAGIGAPAKPTHTYSGTKTLKPNGFGDGLIIYNGLDKDRLRNGQGFGTGTGAENFGRIWLFELLQPFNPDALPCGQTVPCGNGTIDLGEDCDPAAVPTGCTAPDNCDVNQCVCVTPPNCGDGFINPPELCDPSAVPTGCSPSLPICNQVTCLCEAPVCGNNSTEAGEQCDGTDDAACPGQCLSPGDPNECKCPICGDDAINQPGEQCDGIDLGICQACNPPGDPQQCQCAGPPVVCGDNTAQPPEQCDGTDDVACPGQCLPPGFPHECTCPTLCGNNVVDPSEQCDGTDDATCPGQCLPPGDPRECMCGSGCGNGIVEPGETCDPPGSPAGASGNLCRPNCTVCGDGVVQGADGESCDDGNSDECDPTKPQKPLDNCNNLCGGLNCKDPSRIKLGSGLDVFRTHSRMVPIEGGAIDFGGSDFSMSLTAVQNPVAIFETRSLPAGAIEARSSKTFQYKNKAAKLDGGIYRLKASLTRDVTYNVSVVAYGNLRGDAAADMVTSMTVGGQEWTVRGLWRQTTGGWVFDGRSRP